MISLDSETLGKDLYHGAKPFFVTICDEEGNQLWWEWSVDPLTRMPRIPPVDLNEIRKVVRNQEIVFQNGKFDIAALKTIGIDLSSNPMHDTIVAGHLLASDQFHDLTAMVKRYLGKDAWEKFKGFEKDLEKATVEARRIAKKEYPHWKIATKDNPDMPSARGTGGTKKGEKDKLWKNDTWLPKKIGKFAWWKTVLRDYANADSCYTMALWKAQEKELKRRNLWKIYLESMKLPKITHDMEAYGVTLHRKRLIESIQRYSKESEAAGQVCQNLAKRFDYDLVLPKGGNNKSLTQFCFDKRYLNLPVVKKTKKEAPSLDGSAMDQYEMVLPPKTPQLMFIKSLRKKRKRDTAVTYMNSYKRFWVPVKGNWYRLHPSLNQTGSDTLRFTSSNPNEQNISKKEGFNLRYNFGPMDGREWWPMDGQNLELRIPAFKANETDLIYIFEHPKEPPYFGSYHLFIFDLLFPDLFKKHGKKCKELFESTYYKWVKNGNFSIIYGAQEAKADLTYHCPGAYKKVRHRLPKITALANKQIDIARKFGYIETIPDKSVDPERGYQLMVSRSEYGEISPTVPFNYYIQGSAMWWMRKAMVRCHQQLKEWREGLGLDGHLTMQIHDELVPDLPFSPNKGNLGKILVLKKLIEKGGDDIGVPTPVSVTYCKGPWSEGEVIECN